MADPIIIDMLFRRNKAPLKGTNKEKTSAYDAPIFSGKALGYRKWSINTVNASETRYSFPIHDLNLNPFRNHNEPNKFCVEGLIWSGERGRWYRNTNVAECLNCEIVPGRSGGFFQDCHCGFNAWNSLLRADNYLEIRKSRPEILGAIAGWGNTQIHKSGWRSEKAEIIAFYASGNDPYIIDDWNKTLGRNSSKQPGIRKVINVLDPESDLYEIEREVVHQGLAQSYEVPVFESKRKFKKFVKETAVKKKLFHI